MKIRICFVSNSSSSSYVCDITGEEASGYDLDLSEYGMWLCERGHVFVDRFFVNNEEFEEEYDENDEDHYDLRFELPEKFCPICQMNHVIDRDIAMLYLKENDITREELAENIRTNFKSYKEFQEHIK